MFEKMYKKQTLPLIISCALCLVLGLALGYGIILICAKVIDTKKEIL